MILWPAAAPHRPALGFGSGPAPRVERRPLVLLVEDDVAIAAMYRTQLAGDGLQVRQAYDGEEGLAAVRRDRPDLVLLDIRLPVADGFRVLEQMHGDPELAAIPVLILSNYSEPAVIDRGLALGARDYLIKSRTTPLELSLKVRALLGGPAQD